MSIKEQVENPAVQCHLNILQGIINRMGGNSSNCKTLVITLVSAIIVLLLDKNRVNLLYILYIPIFLFWLLDSYYLSLESQFRRSYNNFVDSIKSENFDFADVYVIKLSQNKMDRVLNYFSSFLFSASTLPFYLVLLIIIHIIIKLNN